MIMLPLDRLTPIKYSPPRCQKSVAHFSSETTATGFHVSPPSLEAPTSVPFRLSYDAT